MRTYFIILCLVATVFAVGQSRPSTQDMDRCVEKTREIIAAARTGGFEAIRRFCSLPDSLEKDYTSQEKDRVKVMRQFAEGVRDFQKRIERDERLKDKDQLFQDLVVGRSELSGTRNDPYPQQRISSYDRVIVWSFTFPVRLGSDAWAEQQSGFRRVRWFLFFEPYGDTVRLAGCNGFLGT